MILLILLSSLTSILSSEYTDYGVSRRLYYEFLEMGLISGRGSGLISDWEMGLEIISEMGLGIIILFLEMGRSVGNFSFEWALSIMGGF